MGRRWSFCGQTCRLAFKRDPTELAKRNADAAQAPEPTPSALPRSLAPSPFKELLGARKDEPN